MTNEANVTVDGSMSMSSTAPIEELPKKFVRGVMTGKSLRRKPPTESIIHTTSEKDSKSETNVSQENMQEAEKYFMSLNRAERRKIEKRSHVKIPSTNVPFVNLNKKHG